MRLLLAGDRVPLIARQLYLSPSMVRNPVVLAVPQAWNQLQQELILLFDGFWRNGRTPTALLGTGVLQQPQAALPGLPVAVVVVTADPARRWLVFRAAGPALALTRRRHQ